MGPLGSGPLAVADDADGNAFDFQGISFEVDQSLDHFSCEALGRIDFHKVYCQHFL